MFNLAVFCVLLSLGISEISGDVKTVGVVAPDTRGQGLLGSLMPKATNENGDYNFHASQQVFYINGPLARPGMSAMAKAKNSDYLVTNGIGAHKVHRRKLSWNKARRICIEEGGHLAVIRSDSEEKIVLQMMADSGVEAAWLGLHDKFEEGEWVSVLDEPLGRTGWARWSTKFASNPDNAQGKQHCATMIKSVSGMDDDMCDLAKAFICKIATAF